MTKQFHYALDALLDEYEKQHGKKLKKIQIYEDTGISRTAINRMLDRDTRRADLDTLWTLVTYLRKELGRKVTLDDLLPYKESEDDQKNRNELEALAAWGENPTQIAGLEFNQGNWHRFQDDCNTAACMIGTLRYLCPSTTLEPSDTFHQCVEFDMGEIAEHFGVTEPVAEYMFGIDYNRKPLTFIEWAAKDERYIFELEENPEEIQPQMVAERISEVLALQPV